MLGSVYSQTYSIGDEVSIEDQMSAYEVCYGDYPNDSLKLADFNGGLNGGNYVITFIAIQNGGWTDWAELATQADELILVWQDEPNVKIFSTVFFPTNAFTCEAWGEMGEEGLPVLIETLDMFDWFMNDGFPEAVILDQYMTVFDLPPDYEPDYLYNQIQSALNDCSLYGAGGVAGDVNGDAVVNVLDVVFTVNMILAGEFQAVADINIDSSVDVLDIVLIVIIILRG